MVEDDDISVEDIVHVWRIVLFHGLVFHRNVLEIAYCIERRIAIETTIIDIVTLDTETSKEVVNGVVAAVFFADRMSDH